MGTDDRNVVKLLIPGVRSAEVDINEGETVGQFAERVHSDALPLNRVEQFYVNNSPKDSSYVLQPGDILSGTPKLKGGC